MPQVSLEAIPRRLRGSLPPVCHFCFALCCIALHSIVLLPVRYSCFTLFCIVMHIALFLWPAVPHLFSQIPQLKCRSHRQLGWCATSIFALFCLFATAESDFCGVLWQNIENILQQTHNQICCEVASGNTIVIS